MWRSLLPILGLCSCSRQFGCRFCDDDNNNDSCCGGVAKGRSRFLFCGRNGFGGPHLQCYRDSKRFAVAISKKNKNLDLFPFFGRISQSDLANEAPEQLLCCTRNFAVVIFFLADATFNKLVAGRTLNFLPDVRGWFRISAVLFAQLPTGSVWCNG